MVNLQMPSHAYNEYLISLVCHEAVVKTVSAYGNTPLHHEIEIDLEDGRTIFTRIMETIHGMSYAHIRIGFNMIFIKTTLKKLKDPVIKWSKSNASLSRKKKNELQQCHI